MISTAVLVCGLVAAAVIRPWWARPRHLEVGDRKVPGGDRIPACIAPPGGAVWGGAVVGAAFLHPLLGLAVLIGPRLRHARRRMADRHGSDREALRSLPEVVDLIVLGVGAGLTARAALARCEDWLPPPFAAVFAEARRRADGGESFAAALEVAAGSIADPARPLVNAIVAADQTPGAVMATLVRIGDEARRRRRVEAQERARRLPVTMLLPLVLCVLPAFGLLAVVPLLIGSLRDLGV